MIVKSVIISQVSLWKSIENELVWSQKLSFSINIMIQPSDNQGKKSVHLELFVQNMRLY